MERSFPSECYNRLCSCPRHKLCTSKTWSSPLPEQVLTHELQTPWFTVIGRLLNSCEANISQRHAFLEKSSKLCHGVISLQSVSALFFFKEIFLSKNWAKGFIKPLVLINSLWHHRLVRFEIVSRSATVAITTISGGLTAGDWTAHYC